MGWCGQVRHSFHLQSISPYLSELSVVNSPHKSNANRRKNLLIEPRISHIFKRKVPPLARKQDAHGLDERVEEASMVKLGHLED